MIIAAFQTALHLDSLRKFEISGRPVRFFVSGRSLRVFPRLIFAFLIFAMRGSANLPARSVNAHCSCAAL
jgi:hypothetical protein